MSPAASGSATQPQIADEKPSSNSASRPASAGSRGRQLVIAAGVACVLVGLAYLLICVYLVLTFARPQRLPFARTPADYGLAYEPVTFPSRVDALALDGWLLLPAAGGSVRRPVVVVHGRGSDRLRGVHGNLLEIAAQLVRHHFPVLLFDLRGSGRSEGEHFTLGLQEVWDVGGAVDYLADRGLADDGVGVLGYSMGASTSLLLAPGEPRVWAIAADSGYADLCEVADYQISRRGGWWPVVAPGTFLMGHLLLGVDLCAIRPHEGLPVLAGRGARLLVIHGTEDSVVPVGHGRRIATIFGPDAETFFVPGADHLRGYQVDPVRYTARVVDFFARAE
jgi:dipeptidyl aminopeptidase/acylaminoacyl peptidase